VCQINAKSPTNNKVIKVKYKLLHTGADVPLHVIVPTTLTTSGFKGPLLNTSVCVSVCECMCVCQCVWVCVSVCVCLLCLMPTLLQHRG